MPETHEKRKRYFAEIALALSLLIGTFSFFSISFGLQKQHLFSFLEENRTSGGNRGRYTYGETGKVSRPFFSEEEREQNGTYILQKLEKLGLIHARSFLVGDLDTGEIIFERKADTPFPIASVTKYMTAFTAAQYLKPNEKAKATRALLETPGNRGQFRIGDSFTIRTLLYPLLLVSSNDAAEMIAHQRDRMWFIQRMNKTAEQLGMRNTHFDDPTGLSIYNQSTAHDLFTLMREVGRRYPQIIKISSLRELRKRGYRWQNINRATQFEEFRGGKTGYTNAAHQTSIGYYEVELANGVTRNIGIVILQSDRRQQDTQRILSYLKNYVSYIEQ